MRLQTVLLSLLFAACGRDEDPDGDGWYSDSRNKAVNLWLQSGTLPKPGFYEVLVDEVSYPLSGSLEGKFGIVTAGFSRLGPTRVATRVSGIPAGGSPVEFVSTVRVVYYGFLGIATIVGTETLRYGNLGMPIPPLQVGDVVLNFSAPFEMFSDPNPDDPLGDSDQDGIPESAERNLSRTFPGLGDPRPSGKDAFVVLGAMNPGFSLATKAREDLKTRFKLNGISLHMDDGRLGGAVGEGGAMDLAGLSIPPAGPISIDNAIRIRDANVGPLLRENGYFALLAEGIVDNGGRPAFGLANRINGCCLAMQVGFLGVNDVAWYQAGMFMHEFGHLSGLCHPSESDGLHPGCPVLPEWERDPGASVMGSPAEADNIFAAVEQTLRRPLDFSPTHWTQVRLGTGFSR